MSRGVLWVISILGQFRIKYSRAHKYCFNVSNVAALDVRSWIIPNHILSAEVNLFLSCQLIQLWYRELKWNFSRFSKLDDFDIVGVVRLINRLKHNVECERPEPALLPLVFVEQVRVRHVNLDKLSVLVTSFSTKDFAIFTCNQIAEYLHTIKHFLGDSKNKNCVNLERVN